jgi:CheY-like chemotaxis protein
VRETRDIIAQYLEQDWHQVETASDGIEALRKFESGRFDVVITDQAMPETSGDQLVAAIKQRAPGQRVMMLTGFGAKESAAGTIEADVVLGKPITREALRRGISKLMVARG